MIRLPARLLVAAIALLTVSGGAASAQTEVGNLRLEGLLPGGGRNTLTEAWNTLRFTVENRGDTARQARVVVFYPEQPDIQYARDLWVPGRSRVASWLSVGPAPPGASQIRRDISFLLYDRTGEDPRRVASSEPDERVRSRAEPYRPREATTAVYTDAVSGEADDPDEVNTPDSPTAQAVLFARVFRHARGLSEPVSIVLDRHLPATPEAFDGIDQFVLAGNRLAADPAGAQALRHWVTQGGTLWVMLDRVDPDVVARVLGDGVRFQVAGRTGLTSLKLRAAGDPAPPPAREFERPVDLVRVLLGGSETVLLEANGWPAAFAQTLGRGRVVFTTLGGPGWYRPRAARDGASRFENHPDLPVPLDSLDQLAGQIYPEPRPETLRPEDLTPMLAAEIGYEVVGRRTAAVVLGGFVLAVIGLGVWLRRSRSPELIGLLGPAAAVLAAGVFLATGAASRRAVPPTAAAAAVVEVVPETGEGAWQGLFALYNPESGVVELGSDRGGEVDLDQTGLEGQVRRRVQTDLGTWHWENVAFPAGVRVGPFRSTPRTGVAAVGRFGANGLEGRLTPGVFRNPDDAVVFTRAGTVAGVRLEPDGAFRSTPGDALSPDQYLTGAVLTDRQQRRQEIYRRLLARPLPARFEGRDLLLVWADTPAVPFLAPGATRTTGMALLVVPVEFTAPAGGAVTIPAGFVPYAALANGKGYRPTLDRTESVEMPLRFELPPSARHLEVEKAVVLARVRAPGRKVSVSGVAGDKPVLLWEEVGPGGPVRIEITDPRLLRPDPAGGLLLKLAVSKPVGPDGKELPFRADETPAKWEIEGLGLEVTGRTPGGG